MGIYDRDYMKEGYDPPVRGKKSPPRRPKVSVPYLVIALVFIGIVALFIASTYRSPELGDEAAWPAYPLDLNTATFDELTTVPQNGPATADQILKNRPYEKLEDLLEIYGVGESKLKVFSQYLIVIPPEPDGPAPSVSE